MSYMVLEYAYAKDEVNGETRTVMRFTSCVAPVQAVVLPLMAGNTPGS